MDFLVIQKVKVIIDKGISWINFSVPDDVKGILIKYDDGIFSDRYEGSKRKYRQDRIILGWKFMERTDPNAKSIKCNQAECSKTQDDYCDTCGKPTTEFAETAFLCECRNLL